MTSVDIAEQYQRYRQACKTAMSWWRELSRQDQLKVWHNNEPTMSPGLFAMNESCIHRAWQKECKS